MIQYVFMSCMGPVDAIYLIPHVVVEEHVVHAANLSLPPPGKPISSSQSRTCRAMFVQGKTAALLAIFAILAAAYVLRLRRSSSRLPLPPGPRGLPLIGNLRQIPSVNPWRTLRAWHLAYGPIITVRYGPNPTIVLGSYAVTRELLEKRGSIYSSRPRMVVVGDHVYGGRLTSLLPYGARWRAQHRVQASFLNVRAAQKYHPLQDVESKQLLWELLDSNDFPAVFTRYSASLIFALAYGTRITDGAIGESADFTRLMEDILREVDGNPIVDAFPILDRLPQFLAPWKTRGSRLYRRQVQTFEKNMEDALKTSAWNWTKAAFNLKDAKHLEREEMSFIVGVLHEAAHTVPMVLEVFVMASVLHQDAVRRAQEELDAVVGPGRLPTLNDMPDLPYVNAFIREVFRWRPITPGGMPHAVIQDDEYMGYRIPKGATVVVNHWSLDLDGELFDDPLEFKPERWITNPDVPESVFGFGRRICPGRHVGRNSVLLIIARMLWSYHIGHNYENGKKHEIDPWDMTQGPDSRPMPFKASFRIRSPEHREVVEREWLDSEKDVDVLLEQIASL